MPKYALDSNVYIDAVRQPAALEALKEFLRTALPQTYLSAVVLHELLAGSTSPAQVTVLEANFAEPFARRGRLFAPSTMAWRQAGRILATFRSPSRAQALTNDLLLVLSCREHGITVITRDTDVRRLVRQVPGLRVVAPYPKPAPGAMVRR